MIGKKVMSKGYDARFAGNEELNGDLKVNRSTRGTGAWMIYGDEVDGNG